MTRRVLGRCLALVPLVWLIVTLTFVAVHAVPGSFAETLDNPRLTPAARDIIRHRFGLDQPLARQYLLWLKAVAQGDLGVSFLYRRPVADVVAEALPATALLASSALAVDLLLGLAIAAASVRRPDGRLDRLLSTLSLTVWGMPTFWLAGVAVLVFSVHLGWLPASHLHDVGADALAPAARCADLLRHLILPAGCLGVVGAASTGRYLRSSLLELRSAPFLLAARGRGLGELRLLLVHALRPALLPVVTLVGLSLPMLVSGSLVIEVIFAWPGMGRVLWTAAWARDVPVVLAVTLIGAVAVVLGNLVADLLYGLVDPRVRDGA
jgi:peptide/nickel transport system permease protein